MTKQVINVGTAANDKKGDSLRAAFQKVNANFTELYTELGLANDVTLSLGAFEFTDSVMSTTDSTPIVIDQAVSVTSDLTVGGDIVPNIANGGNLGSLAKPFRSLYVSNNTVFLGGVPLSLEPGTNELRVNNVPVSQSITYTDIPNAPTDVSDLTDSQGLLGGGGGNANTGNFSFNEDTISNDNGMILATDRGTLAIGTNMEVPGVAGHFHIAFNGSNSNPPASDLFLGDDHNYVKLPGSQLNPAIYGVEIGTDNRDAGNSHTWRFGTDGSLTLPDQGPILFGGNNCQIQAQQGFNISSDGGIVVAVNGEQWQFGPDGTLELPTNGTISYTPDDSDLWNDPTVNTIQAALDELAARVTALQNFEIDGGNAYTPAAGELIIDGNGA